jgi:hypothetical protein
MPHIIIISIVCIFFILFFNTRRNSLAANYWPTAPGTISVSEIAEYSGSGGGGTYNCRIRFTYDVNGTTFSGHNRQFFERARNNKQAIEEILKEYPMGKDVAVYYNPKNPSLSCLEPVSKPGETMVPLFIFGSAVIALIGHLIYVIVQERAM